MQQLDDKLMPNIYLQQIRLCFSYISARVHILFQCIKQLQCRTRIQQSTMCCSKFVFLMN